MHERKSMLAAFFAAWLAMPSSAVASPWTREPGGVFISSRTEYFVADESEARFERLDNSLYAEIGLPWKLMTGGKVVGGGSWATTLESSTAAGGLSEYEVFLQRSLFRNERHTASLKLSGGELSRIAGGGRPGLASDGADLELRALYGVDIRPAPFKLYATLEGGYRKRFGSGADQFRLDGLIGIEPARGVLLMVESQSVFSAGNAAPGGADFNVSRVTPSAVISINKRISIQAGASFEYASRGLSPGQSCFIGFWTAF